MANFHLVSNKKERFSGWVSLYTLSKVGDPRAEGQAKLFRLSKWPLKQEHGIKISSWIALLCPWKDQKLYDITETNGSTLTCRHYRKYSSLYSTGEFQIQLPSTHTSVSFNVSNSCMCPSLSEFSSSLIGSVQRYSLIYGPIMHQAPCWTPRHDQVIGSCP